MTQEELLFTSIFDGGAFGRIIRFDDLELFLADKVIVTKGANRHPDADILHQAIEKTCALQFMRSENVWYNSSPIVCYLSEEYRYRIKPSEPVDEWQWRYKPFDNKMWVGFTEFFTDEECKDAERSTYVYKKDETTKRLRQ